MSAQENEQQGPLAASVERLRRELDGWLETALAQGGKTLDKLGMGRGFCPAVDVIESAETVEVFVDLPGIDPQSVTLTLAGNMLTIEAEKPEFEAGDGQTVHTRERHGGKVSRSIPLPVAVDPEKVTADAGRGHGTLRIELGKAERSISRQIPIKAGGNP